MEIPETRYARSGDVNIAYQVFGAGALDLVYVPGWVSHVEETWDDPEHAAVLRRLGSFARVIVFDKRGTGLSDRVPIERLPTLEERMDDVRAVMDAAGSRRAAVFGASEGGNMSLLFAATYPDRTIALVTSRPSLGSTCAPAFTPASASWSARRSPESPCALARASQHTRSRARSSSLRPCAISSPARVSSSAIAAAPS
jgi:pimeloyl-ACP methyl ester carboxylesterase